MTGERLILTIEIYYIPNLLLLTMKHLLFLATMLAASITANAQNDANCNVIVNGNAEHVSVYAEYPFSVPENFVAETFTVNRQIRNGYNTFYLPFFVNSDEIASNNGSTYIYVSEEGEHVKFIKQNGIEANTPFLMTGVTASSPLVFMNKGVVATPATDTTQDFIGVYEGTVSAAGLWGIGNEDRFVRGGSDATIKSFAAYLKETANNAKTIVLLEDMTDITLSTNIVTSASSYYTLSGIRLSDTPIQPGIYIYQGRKIVIK